MVWPGSACAGPSMETAGVTPPEWQELQLRPPVAGFPERPVIPPEKASARFPDALSSRTNRMPAAAAAPKAFKTLISPPRADTSRPSESAIIYGDRERCARQEVASRHLRCP